MPAIASNGYVDGESTPITHTFDPAKTSSDYALWENRVGGIYVLYEKLAFTLTRPKGPAKQAGRELVFTMRLECPVGEALGTSDSGLTPPATVAYRPWVEVTYHLPDRSTMQQRKNLRSLVSAVHAGTPLQNAVDNFSVPY